LAGNEVIITEHGTPVARLAPVVAHSKKKRVAGLNRGTISTSEDFDEPLPDDENRNRGQACDFAILE
jgi:antitoxin (DNA-binding transcriptional repressor) of toxin-antitoxin stability system